MLICLPLTRMPLQLRSTTPFETPAQPLRQCTALHCCTKKPIAGSHNLAAPSWALASEIQNFKTLRPSFERQKFFLPALSLDASTFDSRVSYVRTYMLCHYRGCRLDWTGPWKHRHHNESSNGSVYRIRTCSRRTPAGRYRDHTHRGRVVPRHHGRCHVPLSHRSSRRAAPGVSNCCKSLTSRA